MFYFMWLWEKFSAVHGERKLVSLLSFPKRLGRGRSEWMAWRSDCSCWLCLDHLPVGFMWIFQPFQNMDSGFTQPLQPLYLRWNLLNSNFDKVLISHLVLQTLKALTWFLASLNQYYWQAQCMQFVGPCCSLILLPCSEIVNVVRVLSHGSLQTGLKY